MIHLVDVSTGCSNPEISPRVYICWTTAPPLHSSTSIFIKYSFWYLLTKYSYPSSLFNILNHYPNSISFLLQYFYPIFLSIIFTPLSFSIIHFHYPHYQLYLLQYSYSSCFSIILTHYPYSNILIQYSYPISLPIILIPYLPISLSLMRLNALVKLCVHLSS